MSDGLPHTDVHANLIGTFCRLVIVINERIASP